MRPPAAAATVSLVGEADLEVRTLDTAPEMAAIVNVFQMVWGSVSPIASVELLRAISHAGGYVAGAFESGNIVGASFGFLARHNGEQALHSHITGILPGIQHSGVGRAVKQHQRTWAAEHEIPWITWTFDPLVRRNAWFNIEVLGAEIADYLVNFYGEMTDSINAHDESDRLMVAWSTDDSRHRRAAPVTLEGTHARHEIATPDDIVMLRRNDPAAAAEWRQLQRRRFTELFSEGGVVTCFTRDGHYIVETPA
jgi:predicted GNAT superfamily acetyltransferase